MDLKQLTARMDRNAGIIRRMVVDVSLEEARWKPNLESWSILEVVNHLYDEEREDFRQRLDYVLHKPGQPWPEIDPQGWVTSREYNKRSLDTSLSNFLKERQASLRWLGELDSPNWEAYSEAPWGRITAGDLMASWVAHDMLHMRQLVELTYACTRRQVEPHSVEYAGLW